ncbi:MAG: hypothetical protein ACYCV7_13875, partial [Acidimicrobiales bacterium]
MSADVGTGLGDGGGLKPWRDHLASGIPFQTGDLVAAGTLLQAWAKRWAADPRAKLLVDVAPGGSSRSNLASHRPGIWWTAGEIVGA